LSIQKFEYLINLLEKVNGTMRDTVIQSIALKAILDKSGFESNFVYKLIPDLYKHWVTKREKLGKPLVRKYWPPVLATDTNPHQVFRVRDKERYRLRRHRKNDLDSFRKMQQLRKEFLQAKSILQLILERESINEVKQFLLACIFILLTLFFPICRRVSKFKEKFSRRKSKN
jgi:enhancer of polycomb-like protein